MGNIATISKAIGAFLGGVVANFLTGLGPIEQLLGGLPPAAAFIILPVLGAIGAYISPKNAEKKRS